MSEDRPDGWYRDIAPRQPSVLWDTAAAKVFFGDLAHDQALPKNLITGSSVEGTA